MTWPMRHSSMYSSRYRIRHRKTTENKSVADEEIELQSKYGSRLKPSIVLGVWGPLYGSSPGDITKWMAVPWQTDTASCRSGYEPEYDPYIPTFWPSRVTNHVLAEDDYEKVIDTRLSAEERIQAFNMRSMWLRWLKGDYIKQITQMVKDFGRFGIVEQRKGVDNDLRFPTVMYIESEVSFEDKQVEKKRNLTFNEGRSVRFVRPRLQDET
jgi:hypothetical protein